MTSSIKTFLPVGFIFLGLIFLKCISDAPRNNPLDPQNPNGGVELSGTVSTFYVPHQPIGNARVVLNPGNIILLTNQQGQFTFSNIKPGIYSLFSTAVGFAKDSLQIEISNTTSTNFFLNGLPYFKEARLVTQHISRWFPSGDVFSMQIEVIANDRDGEGDLDKIWYELESFSFADTLIQVTPGSENFRGIASEFDLPLNNLHELIGKPITLFIKDFPGDTIVSENHFLSRIIDETPQLVSPVSLAIINTFPILLEWQRVTNLQYPFSYRIEIFSIDLGLRVDVIENIPASESNFQYTNILGNGDYFWVLYILDEYGNSSSSKEGSFRMQQ
jgi:hypothetical protein